MKNYVHRGFWTSCCDINNKMINIEYWEMEKMQVIKVYKTS